MHEAANIAHRESEYETTGVYLDSNKSVEFVVSQGMIDTFEALHSYYGSCLNWLEQKRVVLDQIKEKMKEEEESHAKMRASRAMRTPAQLKRLYEQNVVFGAPLKSLLQREKAAGIDGQIPSAIQQLVDWIRKYGLKVRFPFFFLKQTKRIVIIWFLICCRKKEFFEFQETKRSSKRGLIISILENLLSRFLLLVAMFTFFVAFSSSIFVNCHNHSAQSDCTTLYWILRGYLMKIVIQKNSRTFSFNYLQRTIIF